MLLDVVNGAVPSLTDPAKVVDLALELENGAAATYVANVGRVHEQERPLRHREHHGGRGAARRDPVRGEGACSRPAPPSLIALPPDAAALPAAAGSVGFPDAFFQTGGARPANEGAVQVRRWKKHPEAMPDGRA